MKTYDITTVITVTQEQIDDVMCTALEGGITYWCDEALQVGLDKTMPEGATWLHQVLTRGKDIMFHESDTENWTSLSIDKLLRVLGKEQFDFDNYDAGDVDTVIQKALFGEVVYC